MITGRAFYAHYHTIPEMNWAFLLVYLFGESLCKLIPVLTGHGCQNSCVRANTGGIGVCASVNNSFISKTSIYLPVFRFYAFYLYILSHLFHTSTCAVHFSFLFCSIIAVSGGVPNAMAFSALSAACTEALFVRMVYPANTFVAHLRGGKAPLGSGPTKSQKRLFRLAPHNHLSLSPPLSFSPLSYLLSEKQKSNTVCVLHQVFESPESEYLAASQPVTYSCGHGWVAGSSKPIVSISYVLKTLVFHF